MHLTVDAVAVRKGRSRSMINYGSKKDEGEAGKGVGEALRSMSDQIGRQA